MFLQEFNQIPSKKLKKLNRLLNEQFGITVKNTFPSKRKLESLLENANMAILKLKDSNKQFQLDPEYAKFLGIKDAMEVMISEGMYAESPRYMEMKHMLKDTVRELMDVGYTVDEATSECMNRYRMDNRFAFDDEYVLPIVITAVKEYMDDCGSMTYESADAYAMNERLLRELAHVMGVSLKDARAYQQIEEKLNNFARVSGKSKESVIGFLNGLDEAALLAGIQMFGRKIGEANAFVDARRKAIATGEKTFTVGGKEFKVTGDTTDEKDAVVESVLPYDEFKKPIQTGDIFKHKYSPHSIEIVEPNYRMSPGSRFTNWVKFTSSNDYTYMTDDKIRKEYKQVEGSVSEGMPSSLIKRKQRLSNMSAAEFAAEFASKSDEDLISMAKRHVLEPMAYVNKRMQGMKTPIKENDTPSDGNWYFVSTPDDEKGSINTIEQSFIDGTFWVIHNTPRGAQHGKMANDHVKTLPDNTPVHVHTPPKGKSDGAFDIKKTTLGQLDNDGIFENRFNRTLAEDVDVEQAEVVMAVRALANGVQDQIERIGRMMNEDLPAIVDKMRAEMGASTAYSFAQSVNQLLSGHLESTKAVKLNLDKSIGDLTGEEMIGTDAEAPQPTLPEEQPEQDEMDVNEPAAAGPEQSPLGRAEI
jgi:hypothetical protein